MRTAQPRVRRHRHRHRHPAGQAGSDLRGVHAGRRVDQPAIRRHRARSVDLDATRADDGRGADRREHAWRADLLPLHGPRRRASRAVGSRLSRQSACRAPAPSSRRCACCWPRIIPVNQRIAVAALTRAGHRVTVAVDGHAALAAVRSDAFDIILMDLQMPHMSGFEATAAIRAREAQLSAAARADHRDDRPRDGQRRAALPRRRHGRPHRQAGAGAHPRRRSSAIMPPGPARASIAARPASSCLPTP